MWLKGKTAIVTGAGQGIGRAIVLAIAREGANVTLASRAAPNLEETAGVISSAGGAALVVPTDVTDEGAIRRMVDLTVAEFGALDLLVNNSGIAGPTKRCEDISREEWESCLAVNLTGAFMGCKHAIPAMKTRGAGRIINISARSGKSPLVNRTPYSVSKAALIGLTRTLAFELGGFGITVNAICPGPVEGPREDRVIEKEARMTGKTPEEVREEYASAAALRRFVRAEDIGALCVHLASERGRNITGQDINVSAGICWY